MQASLSLSVSAPGLARPIARVQRRATKSRRALDAIRVLVAASSDSASINGPAESLARRAILASVPVVSTLSIADVALAGESQRGGWMDN